MATSGSSQSALIGVLTNPNSGKNRRNPGRLEELHRAVDGYGVVRQTASLGELAGVLAEFRDLGCRYWVCDGGDGTLHWMLSTANKTAGGIDGIDPWPIVVPANGGSIDFVAHKAGIRGQAPEIIRALVAQLARGQVPDTIELDTLRIAGEVADDDTTDERIGFATAIGGVAQRFFDKLYQHDKVDAWSIAMVLAQSAAGQLAGSTPEAVRGLIAPNLQRFADDIFEPTRASVSVDGDPLDFDSFSSLQVGSIDISLGGVVRTFRHAAEQGVLHAQAISSSRLGVVANLPNIVFGTPIWGRKVFDGPARRLRVDTMPGARLDPVIDGELCFGWSSLEISAGPKLRVASVCTAH